MSEADSTNSNAAINSASLTRAQEGDTPKIRHPRQSNQIADRILFASGIVALGSLLIKDKKGLSFAEKTLSPVLSFWGGDPDASFLEHTLHGKAFGAGLVFVGGYIISEFTRQVLRNKENEQASHTR